MKIFELFGYINIDSKDADNKIDGVDKKAGGLSKGLGLMGGAALAAGTAIAVGLGAALVDGVKGIADAELATAQLDAVLKSTGGSAGVTRDAATGLADELSRTTMFSYEAALAGENMLLTFTNIGKDVFPLATKSLADMAQATGTDMSGAAVQLGKALNDPTAGIAALNRVGIVFTEQQKAQITAMQQSGDMAGAQSIILQELQKEFGGSAVAAGETLPGAFAILKENIGNITESMAGGLSEQLRVFINYLNDNFPKIQAVIEQVFSAIGVAVQIASDVFTNYILPAVKEVVGFFSEQLSPVFAGFASWVQSNMPAIQTAFKVAFDIIAGVIKVAWEIFKVFFDLGMSVVKFLQPVLTALATAFVKAFAIIAKPIQNAIDSVIKLIDWIKKMKQLWENFIESDAGQKFSSGGNMQYRAKGGSFNANTPMVVGEEGPEIVSFGRSGYVTPNNKLNNLTPNTVASGNNVTINVYDGFNGVSRELSRLGIVMPTRA